MLENLERAFFCAVVMLWLVFSQQMSGAAARGIEAFHNNDRLEFGEVDQVGNEYWKFRNGIIGNAHRNNEQSLMNQKVIRSVLKDRRLKREGRKENYTVAGPSANNHTNTTTMSSLVELDLPTNVSTSDSDYESNYYYFIRHIIYCDFELNIDRVTQIDETAGKISLVTSIRFEWEGELYEKEHFKDSNMSVDLFVVKPDSFKEVWKPLIFFSNEASSTGDGSEKSIVNNPDLKYGYGFYYYEYGRSLTLYCEMNFEYYPADTQRCVSQIHEHKVQQPFFFQRPSLRNLYPFDPNFEFQVESEFEGIPHGFDEAGNDTYQWLEFTMFWRRKISYHMIQTYLPSSLYILIACLSFLIPAPMIEVRIGISMTTLLTLTAMFASVRQSTPSVSYVKAIDIWMVCCIFFVFLTLLQFTTLLWFRSKREIAEKKTLKNKKMLEALKSVIGANCIVNPVAATESGRRFSVESLRYSRHERFAETIEKYGLFVFIFVFIAFSVAYWTWLLVASEYINWKSDSSYHD